MSNQSLEAIDTIQENIQGEVILPDSENYDEARSIWNAMIDRRPAAIVRCKEENDVVIALNYARERNVTIAIRGGGHNIAGNALCDDGLVIDLSRMNSVRVDAGARRVRVGPGATLGDVDAETQKSGLAVPVGINSTTGIAGLTLGGGFGWLTRKFGLTVDNLVSARVVKATGEIVSANKDENSDLFWALRGGGGNFGIVTEFEFKAHPVGPDVLAGLMVFPLSAAKDVMVKHREFMASAPPNINVWCVLRKAPPLPFLPTEVHGQEILALAIVHWGDPEEGKRLIAPLRGFGTPVGEHIGVQPFTQWQQAFDPLLTPGARNYWKSHNFLSLDDGLFDTAINFAGKLPSPHCEIFLGALGGAAADIPPEATAYGNRDANFVMNVHGRWETAEEDETCIGWARDFFKATTPFAAGGVYVNFMTGEETDRISAAFGPNYRRLTEIKAKYDPDNLFHVNQNIPPAK